MKDQKVRFLIQILLTIAGTALMAFGLYMFIAPNNWAPGGISGLSIIISYLLHIPIGLTNFALNLPLLVLGYLILGRRFLLKTVISVVSFTIFYDYIFCYLPMYNGEAMLSALFGGMFVGGGMGLAFIAESSTGGTDISSKILQLKFPHMSIGRLVLLTDIVIISLSVVVFKSVASAMYAVVTMFVASKVIDAIIHGLQTGNMVLIISQKSEQLGVYLTERLQRGVTQMRAIGFYSKREQGVLLCAVRTNEYHRLKRLTQQVDPDAFMIVTAATEVLGEGFKDIQKL